MATAVDPVCGTQVDTSLAAAQSQHDGQVYYFCSVECKRTFDQNPKDCLKQASSR